MGNDQERQVRRTDTAMPSGNQERRGLDILRCPRHNVPYQRGDECPICRREREQSDRE